MTSAVYCARHALTDPSMSPTRMPETTTRLRNVSTITKTMSDVVQGLARRSCRSARKNPTRKLRNENILRLRQNHDVAVPEAREDFDVPAGRYAAKRHFPFNERAPLEHEDVLYAVSRRYDALRHRNDSVLFLRRDDGIRRHA